MDIDHLVRMANSIGEFFAAMPDAQEAREGIASHIHKFWEPRMRRAIYEHIDVMKGEGLEHIVLQALKEHRSELLAVAT
jgi:formate dehydrogenase subunit delta